MPKARETVFLFCRPGVKRRREIRMNTVIIETIVSVLAETEKYLFNLLDKDPLCIHELRGTKGVINGNQSFDDRSYISFYVS
jgi:hypothetical protein